MNTDPRERSRNSGTRPRPWAAFVLACGFVALWAGCAVTTSNYKTLSFFFDGVPDPSQRAANGSSTGGQPTFVVQHRPFVEERCDECHKTKYRPSKNDSSICTQCHAAVQTQYAKMHAAVIASACLWCHNPHESGQPFLLRTNDRKVCALCHTLAALEVTNAPAHADETRSCLECHSGHGSAQPYESLLWMGLVAIAIGAIAQLLNRKAWYLVAGVAAALVSVLFAGLIPLQDRTNALPAVLRSNFWLTIHVLTIVASYGVLTVAAVLGHVYLIREVLLGRSRPNPPAKLSAPLIVQTYRTIQVGLVLLTIGTILGGVWASESWGRFWGWDPKETWALISILTYFAILHARYVQWIKDFGLAASTILAFVVVVWTFYGVNYVMATGLHSYGFGSGGETWVAIWAVAEILFVIVCRVRLRAALTTLPPTFEGTPAHP